MKVITFTCSIAAVVIFRIHVGSVIQIRIKVIWRTVSIFNDPPDGVLGTVIGERQIPDSP